MSIFQKKEEEYEDEEELEETPRQRRIKDLNPEFRKKRKIAVYSAARNGWNCKKTNWRVGRFE